MTGRTFCSKVSARPVALYTSVLSSGSVMFIHPEMSPWMLCSIRRVSKGSKIARNDACTHSWETFSSSVMRLSRSCTRASTSAFAFLYVGTLPSLFVARAWSGKWRSPRGSRVCSSNSSSPRGSRTDEGVAKARAASGRSASASRRDATGAMVGRIGTRARACGEISRGAQRLYTRSLKGPPEECAREAQERGGTVGAPWAKAWLGKTAKAGVIRYSAARRGQMTCRVVHKAAAEAGRSSHQMFRTTGEGRAAWRDGKSSTKCGEDVRGIPARILCLRSCRSHFMAIRRVISKLSVSKQSQCLTEEVGESFSAWSTSSMVMVHVQKVFRVASCFRPGRLRLRLMTTPPRFPRTLLFTATSTKLQAFKLQAAQA
jgi:hypothetical protein